MHIIALKATIESGERGDSNLPFETRLVVSGT